MEGTSHPMANPNYEERPPWRHRGRAWSTGYIKALIDAVNTLA
jgi:hypothetical protein